MPEVVYAEGKTTEQLIAVVTRFLDHGDTVLCSRVSAEQAAALAAAAADAVVEYDERSRVVVARRDGASAAPTKGVVGILAAGTSDVAVAGEAEAMCRAMDVDRRHRRTTWAWPACTAWPARSTRCAPPARPRSSSRPAWKARCPSVVAGLVDVPVIGLPTSTGYGMGGRGEAALLGMLQSCSPGLVVVNIDNGIGAGRHRGAHRPPGLVSGSP